MYFYRPWVAEEYARARAYMEENLVIRREIGDLMGFSGAHVSWP